MAIPVAVAELTSGLQNESVAYSSISGGAISRTISAANSTFTSPATEISSYQYVLLEKPSGSSAALSNATSETATLTNIDVVGTYRVLLIVTDDQAQSSQNDILKAPDTAFVQIHVKTQYLDVVKPSTGERNWTSYYHDFVDACDAMKNTVDNVSVAAATQTALGTVKLAEAPLDAANPEALVTERRTLTAVVNGMVVNRNFTPFIEQTLANGATSWTGPESPCVVAWFPGHFHDGAKSLEVKGYSATMLDGGSKTAGSETYLFNFWYVRSDLWTSNDVSNWNSLGGVKLSPSSTDNEPTAGAVALSSPVTVPTNNVICVTVGKAPSGLGTGLTLTLELEVRH